jgi:hypothetical protein
MALMSSREPLLVKNKTLRELRDVMKSSHIDPLRAFSEACREDLRAVRPR